MTTSSNNILLSLDHVLTTLSTWTGIPVKRLTTGRMAFSDFDSLEQKLKESIYGQEKAINATVAALKRRFQFSQRQNEHRPLWTALFAGSSGVGKTQLARELATHFFGDDKALIKIDLSEFREAHTIARLVGSPPGYKGHGDGGELTNALRRCRSGVLLLDEIEKAHPDILTTVVLPLIGDGIVHDMNDGKSLDATNMVVVMTTNLGTNSKPPDRAVGFMSEDSQQNTVVETAIKAAINGHFPKEVLGRIDDTIIFSKLSSGAVQQIWQQEVKAFEERLASQGLNLGLYIDIQAEAVFLKQIQNNIEREGARAVRRFFDRAVVDRCLDLLRDGADGFTRISIELVGDGLRYRLANNESTNGDEDISNL